MSRRYWPAALAVLALLVFGSYLVFIRYLENQWLRQEAIHVRMYETVQRGLASPREEDATQALFNMQAHLDSLGVPLIVFSPDGLLYAVKNLPFEVDLSDSVDVMRAIRYAPTLSKRNQPIMSSEIGTIYYGSPPVISALRWIPYLQVSGAVLLVIVAFTIIGANVRAERERMWAAMARELAHQMGTPLSSLSGWLEILQLPDVERAEMASLEHIHHVMSADVERLERVSRRFELIGKPPSLEQVRVAQLVHELAAYFQPRLPRLSGGIKLRVRVRRGLPDIRANRVLLVWALENIVKNAVDALAGRGGTIVITATHAEHTGAVRIMIADNGPGIAAHVRDRIFEAGVTTKSAGWGVGLALTRRIIHGLHGGRVRVHSRARGGTIFDIELPGAGRLLRRRLFSRR